VSGRNILRALLLAGGALLFILNAWLFTVTVWHLPAGEAADWSSFVEAGRRITSGEPVYTVEADYAFRYSPLLAFAFAAISPLGVVLWRSLHLALLGTMVIVDRSLWKVASLALVAWPFWFDVEAGNLLTFVLVAGALALRGNRVGIAIFLGLALLVPRPLMLPLVAWILWQHRVWRVPFVGMLTVAAIATLLTGQAGDWLRVLLASAEETSSVLNFGPSRVIGILWLPIGLVLAAVLLWRRRIGLASLVASPYWLPYYFVVLLWDALPGQRRSPA
jgi:hypothetical protein